MPPQQTSRDWARQLFVLEDVSGDGSVHFKIPVVVVYEKLRQHISKTVGLDGFRAIASRALSLAKAEAPILDLVLLTTDGCLSGFEELELRPIASAPDNESGILMIEYLLGFFLTFLGEATTRRLVQEVFPNLEGPAYPVTSTPLDEVLQEVNNLRTVSETLDSLATKHPAAEDGLLLISSNIRNIATILDVFVVVRNASASVLKAESRDVSTNYLM